jgi:hypothetical protein
MIFTPDEYQNEKPDSRFVNGVLSCPCCNWFDEMALWEKGSDLDDEALMPSGLSDNMTAWISAGCYAPADGCSWDD